LKLGFVHIGVVNFGLFFGNQLTARQRLQLACNHFE